MNRLVTVDGLVKNGKVLRSTDDGWLCRHIPNSKELLTDFYSMLLNTESCHVNNND